MMRLGMSHGCAARCGKRGRGARSSSGPHRYTGPGEECLGRQIYTFFLRSFRKRNRLTARGVLGHRLSGCIRPRRPARVRPLRPSSPRVGGRTYPCTTRPGYPLPMYAVNRGYDEAWGRLRRRFLKAHPWCCVEGCRRRANEVDHIESFRGKPELRLEWTNLRSMCKRCHSRRTARDQIHAGRTQFELTACDASGNPTDPRHPWNRTLP
jgi:5-methylcytosine-specific restriction protein A